MTPELAGIFRKAFPEQVAAFRLRLGNLVPTARWDDIQAAQHDRAFMVAGATKAELLADLAAAVDKAIADGQTLDWFRKEFRGIVEKRGWHGWTGEGTPKGEAWRTRVIYRTNLATTYAAGRMAQLVEGGFPLWVYRHGASREPRVQHLAWDGLILPPDHPFWQTHAPPNGWGCSCYVLGARSETGARRLGGRPDLRLPDDWDRPDPKTGAPPGIDKGWGHSPGGGVTETVALAAKKIAALPPEIGSDFGAGLAGMIDRHWPVWLADTMVRGRHEPGLAGVLSKDLIAALESRGAAPASAEIMVTPGLVRGPKADRHEAAGDALSPTDWLTLPRLVRRATAVLLDTRTGKLILILPGDDRVPQLAIELDRKIGRSAEAGTWNLVTSAYRPRLTDLVGRLAGGLVELILGALG